MDYQGCRPSIVVVLCIGVVLAFGPVQPPHAHGSASLGNRLPLPKAAEPSQGFDIGTEAGITAYNKIPQGIVLDRVRPLYSTVEMETPEYLLGVAKGTDAYVYVTRAGWVAAYYPRSVPAIKRGHGPNVGFVLRGLVESYVRKALDLPTLIVDTFFCDFRWPATHTMDFWALQRQDTPAQPEATAPSETFPYRIYIAMALNREDIKKLTPPQPVPTETATSTPSPQPVPTETATPPATPEPTPTSTEAVPTPEIIAFSPDTRVFAIPDLLLPNNSLGNVTGVKDSDVNLAYIGSLVDEEGHPYMHKFQTPNGDFVWVMQRDLPEGKQIKKIIPSEELFLPYTQEAIYQPPEGQKHPVIQLIDFDIIPPGTIMEVGEVGERDLVIKAKITNTDATGKPVPIPNNASIGIVFGKIKFTLNPPGSIGNFVRLENKKDGLFFSQSSSKGYGSEAKRGLDLQKIAPPSPTLDIKATLSADGKELVVEFVRPDGSIGRFEKKLNYPLDTSDYKLDGVIEGSEGLYAIPDYFSITRQTSSRSIASLQSPQTEPHKARYLEEILQINDLSSVIEDNAFSIPLESAWERAPNDAELFLSGRVRRLNLAHTIDTSIYHVWHQGGEIGQRDTAIYWARGLGLSIDHGISLSYEDIGKRGERRADVLRFIDHLSQRVDPSSGDLFWLRSFTTGQGKIADHISAIWRGNTDRLYSDLAGKLRTSEGKPIPTGLELPEDFDFSDRSINALNQLIDISRNKGIDIAGVSVRASITRQQLQRLEQALIAPVIGVWDLADHTPYQPDALTVKEWLDRERIVSRMLADPYDIGGYDWDLNRWVFPEHPYKLILEKTDYPENDRTTRIRLGPAYPLDYRR